MSGPWYECSGPDKKYVINYYTKMIREKGKHYKFNDRLFRSACDEVLPDEGFGSWRGFGAFGLNNELKEQILTAYEEKREMAAKRKINKWLYPIVMKRMYDPDSGKLVNKLKNNFKINATKMNNLTEHQ